MAMSEFRFQRERVSKEDRFRCRKCRIYLFSASHLGPFHKKIEPVEQCSCWYLNVDEDMLPWVREPVNTAHWTEGKIYCPKCKARIGVFNFIQGVRCSCSAFVIPAVWIQKCKVDQVTSDDASKPNIRNASVKTPDFKILHLSPAQLQQSGFETGQSSSQLVEPRSGAGFSRSRTDQSCSANNCSTGGAISLNLITVLSPQIPTCNTRGVVLHKRQRGIRKRKTRADYAGQNVEEICSGLEICQGGSNVEIESTHYMEEPTCRGSRVAVLSDKTQIHKGEQDVLNSAAVEATVEDLPDHLTCPVCLDILYDPFSCACGHVFCDPCLRQLNYKCRRSVNLRCPLCRKVVEYVYPAEELRTEVRKTLPGLYRERHKVECRAVYRKLPLPNGRPKRSKKKSHYPDVPLPYILVTLLAVVFACSVLCLVFLIGVCPPDGRHCVYRGD